MILFVLNWWFSCPLSKKVQFSARSVPPLSHQTSYTHTKSHLYFPYSLTTDLSDPGYAGFSHSICQTSSPFSVPDAFQKICPCPRLHVMFRNLIRFYGELLARHLTPKLEDHPLSTVGNCLFDIFSANVRICRPSPLSATWGRAMPRWVGFTCYDKRHFTLLKHWKEKPLGKNLRAPIFL
jgi:hypothetical protein